MKRLLLAGTAFLGLAAAGLAAQANPLDFTYTGSLVDFTAPTTGTYQILAFGAQGGSGPPFAGLVGVGGRGAEIGGDFSLTAGEILQIAVGGAGGDSPSCCGGGGGGGSFVVGPGNMPLVVAGGGGGGGYCPGCGFPINGQGGLTGPDGGFGGGTGGNGGAGNGGPGGGGGFFSAGGSGIFPFSSTTGGGAFPGLAGGEFVGGFGGGGGADAGAGGGGGYSGGAGSEHTAGGSSPGGGGSFDAGTDQILVADLQTGNGEVVITELVPEPASIALLGAGLAGLAVVWRRRRTD